MFSALGNVLLADRAATGAIRLGKKLKSGVERYGKQGTKKQKEDNLAYRLRKKQIEEGKINKNKKTPVVNGDVNLRQVVNLRNAVSDNVPGKINVPSSAYKVGKVKFTGDAKKSMGQIKKRDAVNKILVAPNLEKERARILKEEYGL